MFESNIDWRVIADVPSFFRSIDRVRFNSVRIRTFMYLTFLRSLRSRQSVLMNMFDTHSYKSKESKQHIEVPVNEFTPYEYEESLEKAIKYHVGRRAKKRQANKRKIVDDDDEEEEDEILVTMREAFLSLNADVRD